MELITIKQWVDEPLQQPNTGSTKEWARRVKTERTKRIVSLAKVLDCHEATIMNYYNDKTIPTLDDRLRIVKRIGRTILFRKGNSTNIVTYYNEEPERV